MRTFSVISLCLITCFGCEGKQVPSQNLVAADAAGTPTERSTEYPQVQWSEPASNVSNATGASRAAWPANIAVVRRHFTESSWKSARTPQFVVLLTENDFFKVTIQPGTTTMVGTVKTTQVIDNGTSIAELMPKMRRTVPLTGDEEALSLFEAYLKQNGRFDTIVRWSDAETDNSNSHADERSP